MGQQPFNPIATATLAVGTTSSNVALPVNTPAAQLPRAARVMNTGAALAFIEFGDAAVVAVAGGTATVSNDGSMPVLPGAIETFTIFPGHTHVAGICAAGGTAVIRVTVGEGE